ncbi:hypothetical protein PAECIP111893_03283 [Paenibacillus plantiphilus]|uniref:Uncharacterized protein n=1 Tax=Paenibacillus plantiphilus TaxID=2905650 RepID=A0ABM9CFA9_9BACL|nr:hypothetical protein PAECIP111893_03283 [Paenibacillus plantiphilus]
MILAGSFLAADSDVGSCDSNQVVRRGADARLVFAWFVRGCEAV